MHVFMKAQPAIAWKGGVQVLFGSILPCTLSCVSCSSTMSETPRIFKATYSGVPVYEMLCKDVAVMRRRSDSYLNATQILKVADFDKPQRTRILEREVQIGKHEKIQGGYGKYQGIYTGYTYSLLLRVGEPYQNMYCFIGTWVPFERGVELAKQYNVDHLLKPLLDFVPGSESPPTAPKHLTAATYKTRKPPQTRRKRIKQDLDGSDIENSSHYDELESDTSLRADMIPSSRTPSPMIRSGTEDRLHPGQRTPKRSRKQIQHATEDPSQLFSGMPYAQTLLQHFISGNAQIPALLTQPPRDLDVNVIIDDEGHTSLHWAAAMGHIETVKALINLNADIYRVNYKGQTALMRSVLFTNNSDKKTFHQLLDMLQKTIFNIDKKDQTVFHHVAATASWKGKVQASRYYMECLIEKLARHRSELISLLNVQDVYGDTALTIAARIGNKKLLRLLIDAGASTEIANEEGMTAQDYLLEVERAGRLSHENVDSPTHATSTSEHAARARLRSKIHSMLNAMAENEPPVPSVSQLFDGFAGSYERDLTQKEQAIKERKVDLELARKRLNEAQRLLSQLRYDPHVLEESETTANILELRFRKLMKYGQKRKLEERIKREIARLQTEEVEGTSKENQDTSPEADQRALQELSEELASLQQERRALEEDFIRLKSQMPERRYQEYKRLISMCCNVAYENVDTMLSPLLASFNEEKPRLE